MLNRKRAIGLILSAVMILSCISICDESAVAWTSPGTGQNYTLDWLADNTNAVSEGQDQDVYYLDDDVVISQKDELSISAGESLYIYPNKRLSIYGDFYINGQNNNEVMITMTNGVRSDTVNLLWEYDDVNGNEFRIDYLEMTYVLWDVTDAAETNFQFQSNYETEDNPSIEVTGQYQAWHKSVSPTRIFVLRLNDIWDHVTSPNVLDLFDDDGDGMPNWWEDRNGFDKTDSSDASDDEDGDGLTNLQEYNHKTKPHKTDTDGDGLWDGPEVEGHGPPNDFTSFPLRVHSDSDSLNDYDEIESDGTPDNYETNPKNPDTDGDTIDDDDEQNGNPATDPTKQDTDDDNFDDNRDPDPVKVNRKFAFVLEVNDYHNGGTSPISTDLSKDCWEVANIFAAWDYDTYFYSDHDYENDPDSNNDPITGVTLKDYSYMTWSNFQNAIADFDSKVGNIPQGNGEDVICYYIDAWGDSPVNYRMWFPIASGGGTTGNLKQTEAFLENELDVMGDDVDFIWIHTPDCSGWKPDIATVLDQLDADDRNVVTTDDDIDDDHDVFKDFKVEYNANRNNGVTAAFSAITSKDNHIFTDRYTDTDSTVKFYMD